ncbi:type II secretion system F family protein [Microvirga sp. M2]|uniref:type II secretion system F family protein n=1 Tax=Microvirga sp. M2 TaxID=3073270 RepID=UPI0039C1462E
MPSPDMIPILVAALAAVSVFGLLAVTFYSRLDRNFEGQKRLAAIGAGEATKKRAARPDESKRRDIEKTLREIEDKQKSSKRSRPSLLVRMRQAGLSWSTRTYYASCGLAGGAAFLILLSSSDLGLLPPLGFGAAVGLLGPHLYVGFRRSRRFGKFAKEFPNAIDVIVRGVKSGLPAADCLRIISVESQDPVREEFREVVEDQTLGLPIDQAVQRLPERIPLAEARFFAIVISMQSRTGGNLSEALGGLSKVLRERQKMQAKIRAMSAEAKTSAGIIGSLPVIVVTLLSILSPKYIEPLFTAFAGKVLLAACIAWMLTGVLVMWKMIRFDF